ncbi:flavodoxin/nitric oxide synthase [Lucifera butyrica]|uniref:Flavodoxin/nitric oxide synthase n=1 Tax=Lucifera butyrica TaxID=1351585 RepID=A0A498RC81_9FIRM|nr:flavodoxin [Lucifera butyrica]VBB08605.1 flavodoxin/nitric oxide synthase [Lucifera butyrica]
MGKNAIKKFVDVILLGLFFYEAGSMASASRIHEILGCVFFVLLIIHNALNKGYYMNLGRGRYSRKRIAGIVVIGIFGISVLVLGISGVAMSTQLFPNIRFLSDWNVRTLHLSAAIAAMAALLFHVLMHMGRYIQGKKFYYLTGLALVLMISGIFGLPYIERWYHPVSINLQESIEGEKVDFSGNVLIVYFSRVGNTEFSAQVDAVSGASLVKANGTLLGNAQVLAMMIQNAIGGDIASIQTEENYPASYNETTKIARDELANQSFPVLKHKPLDLAQYDTIVLVYPLWWGTLPRPVASFMKAYDFEEKTIVPVVTHGGGGAGDSVKVLRGLAKGKVVDPLSVYSSDIPLSRKDVTNYLKNFVIGNAY